MKSSAKNIKLASLDDLFSTEESRADAQREKVQEIPLSELHPFQGHPFKVKDDEAMLETADSIRQYGVLVPAIARPRAEGGYELVAGHRRHRASELAGLETMPVIVRELDDDAAVLVMDNVLDGFDSRLKDCIATLDNTRVQLENARVEVEKPFAQEEELATKSARLEELNALLNMDEKDNELAEPSAEEVEEQNDRRTARSRGMER